VTRRATWLVVQKIDQILDAGLVKRMAVIFFFLLYDQRVHMMVVVVVVDYREPPPSSCDGFSNTWVNVCFFGRHGHGRRKLTAAICSVQDANGDSNKNESLKLVPLSNKNECIALNLESRKRKQKTSIFIGQERHKTRKQKMLLHQSLANERRASIRVLC
jgi:hypothetical protein